MVEIVLFIKCLIKVGHDPDANRWDRIKQEESKLREAMRKVSQVKRTKVIQIDSQIFKQTIGNGHRHADRHKDGGQKIQEESKIEK